MTVTAGHRGFQSLIERPARRAAVAILIFEHNRQVETPDRDVDHAATVARPDRSALLTGLSNDHSAVTAVGFPGGESLGS
jgi:hypothetical protein